MEVDLLRHTLLRWSDADPKHVPLLRDGGITAVVVGAKNEPFEKACAAAHIEMLAEGDLEVVKSVEGGAAEAGRPLVFETGRWPGVQRPDPQSAGATRSLWMDQNCWLVQCIKARNPQAAPVLAYKPDKDAGVTESQMIPYDALELALTDAWVAGGNYLMTPHASLRQALLKGAPDALAAWKKLGRTAAFLRANESLYRQPLLPAVTVLVGSDLSEEVASLSYRHNVSPALISAGAPPKPDPARTKVLVAVGLEKPSYDVRNRILANADAGSTVVVDGKTWWRTSSLKPVKSDPDRDYFALGRGHVIAYKEDIEDPSAVALDLIDFVTQKQRPARIWNCNAGIILATAGVNPGSAILHVINYSRPQELPVLVRIQGKYSKAVLVRPDGAKQDFSAAPRQGGSEVNLPNVGRLATVIFS